MKKIPHRITLLDQENEERILAGFGHRKRGEEDGQSGGFRI